MRVTTAGMVLNQSISVIQYHNNKIKFEIEDIFDIPLTIEVRFDYDLNIPGYTTFDNSENGYITGSLVMTVVNCGQGSTGVFPMKRVYNGKTFAISYHVIVDGIEPTILRNFTLNIFDLTEA